MQFKSSVVLTAIKESQGTFQQGQGKDISFSSTTFHLEVDLPENGAGRSLGRVTRPFKFGDAKEFDKWAAFKNEDFPMHVEATFEIAAQKEDKTSLKLVGIKHLSTAKKP